MESWKRFIKENEKETTSTKSKEENITSAIGDSIMVAISLQMAKRRKMLIKPNVKRTGYPIGGSSVTAINKMCSRVPPEANIVLVNGGINNMPGFEEGVLQWTTKIPAGAPDKYRVKLKSYSTNHVIKTWDSTLACLKGQNKIVIIIPMFGIVNTNSRMDRKFFRPTGSWRWSRYSYKGKRTMTSEAARRKINSHLSSYHNPESGIFYMSSLESVIADSSDGLHYTTAAASKIAEEIDKYIKEHINK